MPDTVLSRWAESNLKRALRTFRIACVVGARQTGKTTLVQFADLPDRCFVSLDSEKILKTAKDDPGFFLRQHAKAHPLIIDEVQKAPELIGEIKYQADRNDKKGQIILTGSADYRKLPHANESLAGRVGFTRVRAFTEAEARGIPPTFLESLFHGKLPFSGDFSRFGKEELFELILKGGYPELLGETDPVVRNDWFRSYLSQQILLDIRGQWGIRKQELMERVLGAAAIFSAKLLVKQNLTNLFEASWKTLDSYLSALQAMFLVDTLPAWTLKDYDRPGATGKLFVTDSGMMAHLLGIFTADTLLESPEKAANEGGKLTETWVYNQLVTEVEARPLWRFWHLRTKSHEIDFLVFDEKQRCIGIEVKSAESVSASDCKHLRWFGDLYGPERFVGIVLYAGRQLRSFGHGCYAVPMPALWAPPEQWEAF